MKCSVTGVVVVLALLYLGYNLLTVYTIFYPPSCAPNQKTGCFSPAYKKKQPLQLWVYTSTVKTGFTSKANLIYHNSSFKRTEDIKESLNITLPSFTLNNGSLFAHVFLGPLGKSPSVSLDRPHLSSSVVPLTRYAVPKFSSINLLSSSSDDDDPTSSSVGSDGLPVTHWIPWLHVHSLSEDWHFDQKQVPQDLYSVLRLFQNSYKYLPILYVDRLKVTTKHLEPLLPNMTLDLSYSPVSIGKLRLWLIFSHAMVSMKGLGFSEKEFDDLKGIFLDTNFMLLGLTIFISVFHLLFDFLAFKNDISFWKNRRTMVGLSLNTILWRCFSQCVVFLYLVDEKTSLLIIVPAGIGTIIEFWKVSRALKVQVTWVGGIIPKIQRGERVEEEKLTDSIDSDALKKLSLVLLPLLMAGAVYQLLYSSHRSWYSWIIQSMVNGVYAFGFLFMLPQLFLNYKLKSVSHLPWKAFMYKAFNTFIDDVFAFIIIMPTSHRIAVFRDDAVFVIFLYQRWLYPVDRSRVNEFGESYEEHEKTD